MNRKKEDKELQKNCKHSYLYKGTKRIIDMGWVSTYQCEYCGKIINT